MKMIVRDFDAKAEEEKVNNLANIIKDVEKECMFRSLKVSDIWQITRLLFFVILTINF